MKPLQFIVPFKGVLQALHVPTQDDLGKYNAGLQFAQGLMAQLGSGLGGALQSNSQVSYQQWGSAEQAKQQAYLQQQQEAIKWAQWQAVKITEEKEAQYAAQSEVERLKQQAKKMGLEPNR